MDVRRAAAASLCAAIPADADAVQAIGARLAELRRTEDSALTDELRRLALRGDADADVEQLVRLRPTAATRTALATLCLTRSLVHAATAGAVRQIASVAFDAGGAFRWLVFAELKELDDRAIPTLIEARGDPSADVQAWARDTLDTLGRRTPGDAVQTSDDKVLVDVLSAFGSIRDPDALPVVLSFVNSGRAEVRGAARDALHAYGPAALGRVRSAYASVAGKHLPEAIEPGEAERALFDAYDHQRLADVYARWDEGRAKDQAGDLEGAIAEYTYALAREPNLDRGAEAAPAYAAYAKHLEGAEPAHARDMLRTALRLFGAAAGADTVRSELHRLDGDELRAAGVEDDEPYEQALALDPANDAAKQTLARLRADQRARTKQEGTVVAGVGGLGACLVGAGLLGLLRGQRRRRR